LVFDATAMKKLSLAYGSDALPLTFDEEHLQLIASEAKELTPFSELEIGAAIDSPINSPSIEEIFSAEDSVLIVVSDATRATGSAQCVNLLIRRLIQIGVSPTRISIIFATGIHRPVTPEEKVRLLTPFVVQRISTLDHDASDSAKLMDFGVTARGTRVQLNRALKDFDHVIVIGGIAYHYFAGFTGGRKSICPGLASSATVEATHIWAMDFQNGGRRVGVGAGLLEGNLVHEECENIAALINPSFTISTIVDEKGRIVKLFAGHWREAHRAACAVYHQHHSVEISETRDLVIAGCGGFPYDINLIQAHKTLDMASHACTEGGTIVLVAECRDGLGRADFLQWFAEPNSRALEHRLSNSYQVNGQTAWALLTKAERFRIFLISQLDPEAVRQMRMTPGQSLGDVLAQVPKSARGYVMPRGAASLPVLKH